MNAIALCSQKGQCISSAACLGNICGSDFLKQVPGRVHADDREIEGDFWFAKITSEMFVAPEGGFVFADEEFATDFLLVKIRWFQALSPLSESQSRVYKLLSDERCLSVMAVMRIDSVEVTQLGQARSNRFKLSQAEQRRIVESS